jgi:hypothetical protein
MVYRGRVKHGVIRLESPAALPEGCEVCVQIVPPAAGVPTEATLEQEIAAIWADVPESEWNHLPPDLTRSLDHYVYGTPE